MPAEFTDPHPRQAGGDHLCGVLGPLIFGPVFRVIANAKHTYLRLLVEEIVVADIVVANIVVANIVVANIVVANIVVADKVAAGMQ